MLGKKSMDLDRIQGGVVLKGVRGGEALITAYGMKNVFSIKDKRGMILIMTSLVCAFCFYQNNSYCLL